MSSSLSGGGIGGDGQGSFQNWQITVQINRAGTLTTFSGFRVSCGIVVGAKDTFGLADIRIFGLSSEQMNDFARINGPVYGGTPDPTSYLQLLAGPPGKQTLCYQGMITDALPDFNQMPDVPFTIHCITGYAEQLAPSPAKSFPGTADVAQIMGVLAAEANLVFENNGVVSKISNCYLWGPLKTQITELVDAARINISVECGVLAIWPLGGNRPVPTVDISPAQGLVGYPQRTIPGMDFRCLFSPVIKPGVLINMDPGSQLSAGQVLSCRGLWAVLGVKHTLESQVPGGAWFSDVTTLSASVVAVTSPTSRVSG